MPVSRFAGRTAELATLGDELGEAGRERIRIVFVVGEAGVGKTRLLAEFAATSRATVLVGRGATTTAEVPFSVFVEAIESRLRGLSPHAVAGIVSTRARPLAAVLPSVAAAVPPLATPPARAMIFEAFVDLLRAIAGAGTLVLALDDLHAADPSSWELIGYLARAAPRVRVLVIGAARTDGLAAEAAMGDTLAALRQDGLVTELRLAPLGRDDLRTIASDTLGAARADPDVVAWLHERSRGNALYAVALLEELAFDPSRRVIPLSIRERVRATVRTLGPDARDALELAAVLGGPFSAAAILALMPGAARPLDELVRSGLLIERSGGTSGYEFSHPIVQESVYEGLGLAHRRVLHRRVARDLLGEPLAVRAHHAARGALPGDTDAAALLREAAQEAARQQAHREAIAHLYALLALLARDDAQRADVLDAIAWHASECGDHVTGEDALRELGRLVESDATRHAATKIRLASFLASGSGDLISAEREARGAVDLLRTGGRTRELSAALNELGWIRGQTGDVEAQLLAAREALALAESLDAETAVLHALGSLGHALALSGRSSEARSALERGRALAIARDDRSQIGWHSAVLAEALAYSGHFAEALSFIDSLEAVDDAVLRSRRAMVAWYLGDWPRVLGEARAIRAVAREAPAHSAWVFSLAAVVLCASGSDAESNDYATLAERVYRGRHIYWFSATHEWLQGIAAAMRGRGAEALRSLDSAAAQLERLPAPALLVRVLPDLADVQLQAGATEDARRTVARATALASVLRSPFALAAEAHVRAVIDGSVADLTEAATGWDRINAPHLAARALERAGGASVGPGRLGLLSDAARRYAALGDVRGSERARAELRTSGTPGRRRAQRVGELTAREREIAMLAQRGLSARQMAERLSVSERTVEAHLDHIYAKLGVDSRAALAAVDLAARA